jgi:hypothetical protein
MYAARELAKMRKIGCIKSDLFRRVITYEEAYRRIIDVMQE